MKRKLYLVSLLAAAWLLLPHTSMHAQEDEGDAAMDEAAMDKEMEEIESMDDVQGQVVAGQQKPAIYLPLKPAFVVNYGGAGPLRYLKTEMSVRLASADVANAVRHHLPYIRNNLVMLFARQTEETMNSQEGRELMRQEALVEIQKVVMEEEGKEGVLDVYFNSFIVQN